MIAKPTKANLRRRIDGALAAAHADDGHAQPQACVVEGLLEEPSPRAGATRDDAPSSPDGVAARIGFKTWMEQVDPVFRQVHSASAGAQAPAVVGEAPPSGGRGARPARSRVIVEGLGAQRGVRQRRCAAIAAVCGGGGGDGVALRTGRRGGRGARGAGWSVGRRGGAAGGAGGTGTRGAGTAGGGA